MPAYYNEHDRFAAAWLRTLISKGLIADGDVDERDIQDVAPADLAKYDQCHFFAGIGGWSLALRLAGWPDDRPVWTGSCPCQPFSAAGKSDGFADERHLWPVFHHLIRECLPDVVMGEQVAAALNHGWLDLVQADLEGEGYAFWAEGVPACGVGAPHIRQRLWWLGHALPAGRAAWRAGAGGGSVALGDANDARLERWGVGRNGARERTAGPASLGSGLANARHNGSSAVREFGRTEDKGRLLQFEGRSAAGELANFDGGRAGSEGLQRGRQYGQQPKDGCADFGAACGVEHAASEQMGVSRRTRLAGVSDAWANPDWIFCRDGRWRPVESGSFPLAHGISARVGRLRAYGNAIVPQAAAAFIKAYLDCEIFL